jgi:hypothetical protein
MSKRILGSSAAIEQGKEYSGGPGQPNKTVRVWKGTKAAVLAKLSDVQDAGYVWRLREEGPNATLEAETPNLPGENENVTVVSDVWEMLPGEAEKDLLEVDITAFNSLTKVQKEAIRKNLQQPPEEDSTTNLTDLSPTAKALTAYKLMLLGQRSKIVFAPVLRRTMTVSSLYSVTVSVENANRIIKASTIIASEGLPLGFLIALNSSPFAYGTATKDGLVFSYGFLKKYPNLLQTVGGRLQIIQEWAFGLWSVDAYGVAL